MKVFNGFSMSVLLIALKQIYKFPFRLIFKTIPSILKKSEIFIFSCDFSVIELSCLEENPCGFFMYILQLICKYMNQCIV